MFKKNINRYNVSVDKLYKVKNAYSKLKNDKKITEEFELFLEELSLEELIAIKLHISTRFLNGKLTLNIFENMQAAVFSILMIYSFFNYKSLKYVASFLGISYKKLYDLLIENNMWKYYSYIKNGENIEFEDNKKILDEIYTELDLMSKEKNEQK